MTMLLILQTNPGDASWAWLEEWGPAVFFLAFILLIAWGITAFVKDIIYGKKKRKAEKEQQRIQEELRVQVHQQYLADVQRLTEEYGQPDKLIVLSTDLIDREIRLFSAVKKVLLQGQMYNFTDILSASYTDEATQQRGNATIRTQGQSVGVGIGTALGSNSAIGLGTSATRSNSVVRFGKDTTEHNYTVWINVRNLTNPVIELHTGADLRLTNEIVALMNVIASESPAH